MLFKKTKPFWERLLGFILWLNSVNGWFPAAYSKYWRFARRSCWLIIAALIGWSGFHSYLASHYFTTVRGYVKAAPVVALGANLKAYYTSPHEYISRLQLILTIGAVQRFYKKTNIDPKAADLAYRIAKTASPLSPMILNIRGEYLINSNRANEKRKELVDILQKLLKFHPRYGGTWVLVSSYGLITGRDKEARDAFMQGIELAGEGQMRRSTLWEYFETLESIE